MKKEDRTSRFEALSDIGNRIAAIRKQKGMTQSQIAGGDVTRNMLSRIENGAALPSLPTLCAIAERLCVPVGALLGDIDDYTNWQLANDMQKLIDNKRYGQVIEALNTDKKADSSKKLSGLLCEAYIGRAEEYYSEGKLTLALGQLDAASSTYPDTLKTRRIFLLRTLIAACPALYPDDAPTPSDEHTEHLRATVFEGSDTSVYLYAVSRLGNLPKSAYSQPLPEAKDLKYRLKPLIEGISNNIFRTHIDAKLDMVSAEYLDAKAKLLTIIDGASPALLYDILGDIEFCCKCCGDFENAYKYSARRLELAKRIN